MFRITAILAVLIAGLSVAEAKPRTAFHPDCNIIMPCAGAPMPWQASQMMTRREAQQVARAQRFARTELGGHPPETQRSFLGTDLVAKARQYMGGNPTGWSRVWCGRFMAMIAPNAAARIRNPNMARAWAALPHVSPQVGAIAVLSRGRGGGHVGVVSGFDGRGNPIIVSGNHGRRVGEGVYPAGRVLAYVSAS